MTTFRFPPLRRAACAAALAFALPAAMAWTDKPVRMLVPAPAGGTIRQGAPRQLFFAAATGGGEMPWRNFCPPV